MLCVVPLCCSAILITIKYLNNFILIRIIGATWGGLSISETADLLGFSYIAISRDCREKKENIQ